MRVDELDYELPRELIATEPPPTRDGGRMLCVHRDSATLEHRHVRELGTLVPDGALVVVNDTRVINARLLGSKASGGRVEIFLLKPLDVSSHRWQAFGRANKPLRNGARIQIAPGFEVEIAARRDDGTLEVLLLTNDPASAIETHGHVPLPPYMQRAAEPSDRERYQTVYARNPGAVAAPTAGLHLTNETLTTFATRNIAVAPVTLHVGAGTFAPITVDDLNAHPMHEERYLIPPAAADAVREAKAQGRRIVAIGTTSVRALESWGLDANNPLEGDTRLLIQPGYQFRVVDALLTNFHLPRSTLLALVMAIVGVDLTRRAYAAAIEERYRFFSYGDAMWIP